MYQRGRLTIMQSHILWDEGGVISQYYIIYILLQAMLYSAITGEPFTQLEFFKES